MSSSISVASEPANGRCLNTLMGLDTICQALVLKTQLGSERWRSSTQHLVVLAAQVNLCPGVSSGCTAAIALCMQTGVLCAIQTMSAKPFILLREGLNSAVSVP